MSIEPVDKKKSISLNKSLHSDLLFDFETEFRRIRKKRVTQITLGVMLALLLIGSVQYVREFYSEALILFSAFGLCVHVLLELKRGRVDQASNFILLMLVGMSCAMAAVGGGLKDVVLFAFPGLIIFSSMLSKPRQTLVLLIAIVLYILLLGVGTELNWWQHATDSGALVTALFLVIILLVVGLSIYSLHRDMINLQRRLQQENELHLIAQHKAERLALLDSLTELPNRLLARERFESLFALATRNQQKVALMYIDLDEFKVVNDSYGHEAGDRLLIEVAARFRSVLRDSDTVCRLGGDEFLVLINELASEAELGNIAQKLLDCISLPFAFGKVEHVCSGSMGIAIAPNDGDNFDELLKHADMAMYLAKKMGRNNYQYFDEFLQEHADRKLDLINAMRLAISKNEFTLVYQPKIDLGANTVVGAEALIRWNSTKHGLIMPDELIPIAESSGLIHELGAWVVDKACTDLKYLREQGFEEMTFSINVSVAQLQNKDLCAQFFESIEKNQLSADAIDIEITETMLASDHSLVAENLKMLRKRGVTLSIDDFGTGYSNLGYLKRYDVETLKIDKSFIFEVISNPHNQAIVNAIMEICSALDMEAVAEGVEDAEVAEFIKDLGCGKAQGFYWAKPLPIEELLAFARSY